MSKFRWSIYAIGLLLIALNSQCQSHKKTTNFKPVKVDFDFSQRKIEEVHDPTFLSWSIKEEKESSKSFGDLKVAIDGDFTSGWYKVGVHPPLNAKLVSDGLTSASDVNLTFTGLKPGKHSLLTFHNTFDSPENGAFSSIQIFVNDKQIGKSIKPTNRAKNKNEAATSYITFEVKKGEKIKVTFKIDKMSSAPNKELVINGFELDTPNIKNQASLPNPTNEDGHIVSKNGNLMLKWKSPENAVSHNVYFGKSKEEVSKADENSEFFKGNQKENEFKVEKLYSGKIYYWRVDEKDKDGTITRGNVWSFEPAQLAFKGAEGYGRFAKGGRYGKVVEVTNLNDSGPGSFREAVTKDMGPRIVVFTVGGNIELKSRLVINQPYITVAGQTAPGEGITFTRAPVGVTGDDNVMRFVRVRIGAGRTFDGMGLTGADYSIVDHCSISWTIDESFSSRGAHHITLQRTLISEALNVANHHKYKKGTMHGYAATIGGDIGSFHHNLLAHNYGRNWSMGGGLNGDGYYSGRLDIRNNVVYNWGHRTTDGGAHEVDFVNNFYKPGPGTSLFFALTMNHEGVGLGSQRAYFSGNVMPGVFGLDNQKKGRRQVITNNEKVDYETFVDKPFFKSYVKTQSAEEAYKNVLSDVGMNEPYLDKHDQRIIQETIDSTYHFKGSKSGLPGMIDTQKDVGGFPSYKSFKRDDNWDTDHDGLPNWWENAKGLNPNSEKGDFSDAHQDTDHDGFTQLDDYLDWMAHPHYFVNQGGSLQINVSDLFRGYTNHPEYSIKGTHRNIKLNKTQLNFKGDKKGMTSFEVTVKDAEGGAMTREINVVVQ